MRPTNSPTAVALLRALIPAGRADAHSLGVPVDAFDALVDALRSAGVALDRDAGGGVRLQHPIDLLDGAAIARSLDASPARIALEIVDECGSTNADLMARAAAGAPSGIALVCESQTAGRGRRGSGWIAPIGGALAFSVLWRFARPAAALAGLSLAVGVACVRGLARCGVAGVGLKWPNDLVHGGRKLGGILIEAAPDAEGTAVVCGIGLNVRVPESIRRGIPQAVTDAAQIAGTPPSRSALLAALLIELDMAMRRFAADGFAAVRDEWLRAHAYQDRPVRLVLDDARSVEGRAVGVAEDGALLLERGGAIERYHAGEVSLRAA
jgi:BirA family transcriptional regulator, biotin operon repressor / biotin---[acetyl-CoA-carboxylase] ligase